MGSTVALVSIVAAFGMRKYGIGLGLVEGILAGVVVGLINGLVITRLGVFPFIATLAMLSILSGLALNLSGGIPVSGLPERFGNFAYESVLGIPAPFIVALVVLAVSHFVLRYTRFGRQIYAVGGNQEAARLSGIQINRVKILAYVFCSFFAAIGSIVLTSRVASGQPTLGVSLPLKISRSRCPRRRLSVWRARFSHRGSFWRRFRQHPLKWAQSFECVILHADDGDRSRFDRGSWDGSVIGKTRN